MSQIQESEKTEFKYTQPFKNLPYNPKNWYLSIFKTFSDKYPRGFYNVSIRPLLNLPKNIVD